MKKFDREPIAWITRGGKHVPIFDEEDEKPRLKTYGYDRIKLADMYSYEELNELRQQVIDDPKSQNPGYEKGSIRKLNSSARKKLDNIAWAVTNKIQRKKKLTGKITI